MAASAHAVEAVVCGGQVTAQEKVPAGWEGVAKAMPNDGTVGNKFALLNYMNGKGYSPHKEAAALVRRAYYECQQESISPSSIGFVLRKGAKGAAA